MDAVYIVVPAGVALAAISGAMWFLKRRRKDRS